MEGADFEKSGLKVYSRLDDFRSLDARDSSFPFTILWNCFSRLCRSYLLELLIDASAKSSCDRLLYSSIDDDFSDLSNGQEGGSRL